MKLVTGALDAVYKVVELFTNILMAGLFVVVILGVVSRYVFLAPFYWTEELALFILAWMVFLGASLIIRKWENLRVTYFVEKLPPIARVIIEFFCRLIVLAFLGYVLVVSARVIPEVSKTEVSPALNISMYFPQMSLVAGLALMVFQLTGLILETVASVRRSGRI